MQKVFGTDGVRGRSNRSPMTAAFVQRLGMAAGATFMNGEHRHHVVIGKDTRLSGYMMETALTSGFLSLGMNVMLVGPLPTAAIPMLVQSMRCDLGVMISGSHNPGEDNGIKLFGPDSYKLSREREAAIEERLREPPGSEPLVDAPLVGRARRIEDAVGRYIEFVKRSFPSGLRLDGIRVVVDCAHGAAYRVAPRVLWELGAEVIALNVEPDGTNINRNCGSVSPGAMAAEVRQSGAALGIALDGDADRCVIADEHGRLVEGDRLLALIVRRSHDEGRVRGGCVVGTPMSNLGYERYLETLGLSLVRAPVGDRNVAEAMRTHGCNLGGEPSGHIILGDHNPSGDGLASALQVLAATVETGHPVSQLLPKYEAVPSLQEDIVLATPTDPLDQDHVQASIQSGKSALGSEGRLVVRRSGTESKLRIYVESSQPEKAHGVIRSIRMAVLAGAG